MWLAYLSVGEIHESLPYFDDLQREGALLGPNPHWPGAYYVDVGHPAWQRRANVWARGTPAPRLDEKG